MNNNADSLAQYFANITAGRHNQHAIVRVVGSAGTGKSYLGVGLCVEYAKCVAEMRGGEWRDYFTFNKNMAVMDGERIKEIMTEPKKFSALFCDDVGVPLNARKFMSNDNISFNDTIQTFRPNNNLVVMTLQAGFLMDKVPRTLAHYEIEMERAEFDLGLTIAKVNKIVVKHKTGDIHYPYIFINGTKYKRHIAMMPDAELMTEYEQIRSKQLAKMEAKKQEEPEPKTKKSSKIDIHLPAIFRMTEKGLSSREISNEFFKKDGIKIAQSSIFDVQKRYNLI